LRVHNTIIKNEIAHFQWVSKFSTSEEGH